MADIPDAELAELKKKAAAADKAAALAEALQGKLTAAEASAAKVKELEAQVAAHAAERLDATFKAANITDPKIRRVFELEHAEVAAAEGGEKDLGKWLDGLKAAPADKRPAHLAPFLPAPGQAGGTGGNANGAAGAGKLPNANKGAGDVTGAPPVFTEAQIAAWTPQEFAANYPKLQALHPDKFPSIPLPFANSKGDA